MNYLAHIYLSGESEELMLGNFIGDYVKGKQHRDFPTEVERGILLHRKIDEFTDRHEAVRACNQLLRPGYRKYAGVVTDIFFDHFLAANWQRYSNHSLKNATRRFHGILMSNYRILPARVKLFTPFLIQHKRLESYAQFKGIEESLSILSRRTSLPEETPFAMKTLTEEYAQFDEAFARFFPEIIQFAIEEAGVEIKMPRLKRG
ncbi:ACP phosphodiesterase [Prolixibacter denitrificans]|uniref:ACP phosphodiesterase n=1 Tax=Prolixibacter denitrificans TaxID=1541063 RepID=A0A2P8C974_9BACT|nr:ACP phosphodiesterase [Prolixibacter denitrificans]PSK81517.1 acyl carrier protein phosphodiesterase [Prolixibacter denitrificans]GET21015.1 ACP phosphodiesterase [Prolixibacter denitrificans]